MHEVIHGDSAVVLGHFEDCSIDAVVTDPPHGLGGEHIHSEFTEVDGEPALTLKFTRAANGFMGASWDKGIGAFEVWRQVYRVLKPGGHVFVMSSERAGGVAGFYLLLKAAGFIIDETQLLNWVSLTGMPKSVDTGKVADKQAFRDWLAFVGADVTAAERRKAESAAVNGEFVNPLGAVQDGTGTTYSSTGTLGNKTAKHPDAMPLLSRLLALHWPASAQEQRAHWEAVVPEVPRDWDCSRPPGVRVKTGRVSSHTGEYRNVEGERIYGAGNGIPQANEEGANHITAPSTPDAVALEGRRASVAPLKPFAYPIIHAQKPCEGSYLANWRTWGTGPMGVGDARIPFADDADEASAEFGVSAPSGGDLYQGKPTSAAFDGPPKPADPAGRTPSNLLSYADLLGDLQRYADLSAWCEALGLPESAAALLEAGLVYAPKPSRKEKEAGLEGFAAEAPANPNYGKNGFSRPTGQPEREIAPQRNTHPTAKPTALCAYLVTLATAPGQTVLDPFCGSGSTGVAAALIGRNFIGIELDPEDKGFADIARARIAHAEKTVANREPLAADCAERTGDTCADVSAQPALMEV